MGYTKSILTIIFLSIVVGFSFYVAFERTYAKKISDVEHYVAPVIDTVSSTINKYAENCPNELEYDVYKLKEKYFNDTQALVVRTVIHYFPNSNSSSIPNSTFQKRVDMMNDFFRRSNTKLFFELDSVYTHKGKPSDNPVVMSSIKAFESFLNKERDDLREYYYGEHVDFHNNIFSVPNHLNIYVYNDNTQFTGKAGDIESTYFGVSLKYMHPELYTFEHESGHCFGLYHTHTIDNTGKAHSTDGGDFVCDTHVTFPMSGIVDDSCELYHGWRNMVQLPPYSNPISSWDNISPSEIENLIKNVMSYTRHQCRQEFSYEQVRRMKKILENNKDLRSTIKGIDTNLKGSILKNLAEIQR